jgi:hypothetical protein
MAVTGRDGRERVSEHINKRAGYMVELALVVYTAVVGSVLAAR